MSVDELLYRRKYPTTSKNYIGIEIECLIINSISEQELPNKLIEAGLQWNVHLGQDGSVVDNTWRPIYNQYYTCVNWKTKPIGTELRILVEESEFDSVLDKVCRILKECKAYVNNTCGLHIHLDMRNRDYELAFKNLYKMQTTMLKTQPKHRKNNKFCRKVKSLKEMSTSRSRYKTINPLSYKDMRTIEVRLHEGTIDYNDIKNWSQFLINIVDTKEPITKVVKGFKSLPLSEQIKEYLNARIKKYS